jgi:hypothetical protein
MKTTITLLTIAAGFLTGCAAPADRHEARVDRRDDRYERTGNRVDTRQGNRYDRRVDRHERIETRYGY